jgi:hypothetical protein
MSSVQDTSEGGGEGVSELTASHGGAHGLQRWCGAGQHKHCIHGSGGTVKGPRRCDLLQLVAGGTTGEAEAWSTDSCYGGVDGS